MQFRSVTFFAIVGVVLQVGNAIVPVNTDLAQVYFFYGPSYVQRTVYNLSDLNSVLIHPSYQPDRATTLYIHGYTDSTAEDSVQFVVAAYLANGGHNTLVLDWGALANGLYTTAVSNSIAVGKRVANVLISLFKAGLSLEKFHLVGHSLGAQMSGIIGNSIQVATNEATVLPRITGLDPAGPLFWEIGTIPLIVRQLNPKDAVFVDVIHTDAGFLGIPNTCGTVDFWPNAGIRVQPGCLAVDISAAELGQACNHNRAWRFWADSLGSILESTEFTSVQATDYLSFTHGEYISNQTIPMGINCPTDASGSYFLKTNEKTPFGMGAESLCLRLETL